MAVLSALLVGLDSSVITSESERKGEYSSYNGSSTRDDQHILQFHDDFTCTLQMCLMLTRLQAPKPLVLTCAPRH
jgi:hypothetical protein